MQNPNQAEFVEHTHKNALEYDTTRNRLIYFPTLFYIAWVDSDFSLLHGLLFAKSHFILSPTSIEKIEVKNNELDGTIYSRLEYFPGHNIHNLESVFGPIKSYGRANNIYNLHTSKYLLKVDTLTYRIKSLERYDVFEGKIQYDEYKFILLSEALQNSLTQQATSLIESSKDFRITTFKEINAKKISPTTFQGQKFSFANLSSFNTGALDTFMKNKYVIFDFFYESCYPCHQMTKWVLDWIPTADTSKIVLIGVDPTDKQKSMELFVKDRGITYPIIIEKQALDIMQYYHVHVYPTLFLLSPDGKIQIVHEGMSKRFLTSAEKIVKRQSL